MPILRDLMRLSLGRRLPVVDGTLRVTGVRAPITIRRDAHGIAYVEATNDDDAFFGMGFCHAQDRSFQMELYVRAATGRLAEVFGPEMLPVDRLMRRIGITAIARRQLELVSPRERAQIESFTRGLNGGLEQGAAKRPHEFVLLGITPSRFEPTNVLCVLQFFAFALSTNWDAELARLRILRSDGAEALHALEASDPKWTGSDCGLGRLVQDIDALAVAEKLAEEVSAVNEVVALGGASNAWALAPSRTKTGRAILACDPHLSPSLPAPWYLMHVRTPSWAMSGACFPGNPVATFGHNAHVAWAMTAGHVDNTDLFLERVGPDGASVREGRVWAPCGVRTEVIAVKGRSPVVERVLETKRGPIVSPALGGNDVALSLRGTWMAARKIGGYDIYLARNVDDACAAYASYPALSENRVFADTGGRIAWHVVGDAPRRRRGAGLLPAPGWDPEFGWEDEPLPYEALPHAVDPEDGIIASANQDPGPSPLNGVFLGADWLDGSRHARILEILRLRHDWDVETTMRAQTDRKTALWRRVRNAVLGALQGSPEKRALQWLEGWDGVAGPESVAASIFEVFFAEMAVRVAKAKAPRSWRAAIGEGTNAVLPHGTMALRRIDHLARVIVEQPEGFFRQGWRAEIAEAVGAALGVLRRAAGKDDRRWAWGRVRPVFLVHPLGTKRPLDRIWNRGPLAFGGDATTIPQASMPFDAPLGNAIGVPNLRVVMDVGNWEASRYVLAGGQSGNPMSPHYDDMVDLWLRGESVTMAWSPEAVRTRARSTLNLVPR